jgi:molecular chaperone GrpE (heat shock protein)
MQKEMEWAKKGMEKYIEKHERMPVRASNDSNDLYPVPDNLHKATSSGVSQDSQDEEIDINGTVSIMQKEMEWAKKGMEKYIEKHEIMPVRASNDNHGLYPVPDNLHKATSSGVSRDSQDEEIDIMEVYQTSAHVRRRRNIV